MLATACGYTYPQIDEMTVAEVNELCAYWRDHPPIHILAAAYLGIKASGPAQNDPSELFKMLGCDPNIGGTMRMVH